MKKLLSILLAALVWWIFSIFISSDLILPSPGRVLTEIIKLFHEEEFYRAMLSTFVKGLISALITTFLGVVVGSLMGIWKWLWDLFRPIVLIVQSVPVVSWLVVVVFAFGMGWRGPILITVLSLFPIVALNTATGFEKIDRKLVEIARVYKVNRLKVFRVIYLGSLVPFTLASLEIVLGNVWKTTVVAEFLAGDEGIGVMIAWARTYVDTPRVLALTVFAISFAFVFEGLFRTALKGVREKWGQS
jgi:NitT/TauT family transport system permease protein